MKNFIIYFFIVIFSVILFVLINLILGIGIDILNIILSNSILKWFYSAYGIIWKWDFGHYCLVGVISLSITYKLTIKLINKLKVKGVL